MRATPTDTPPDDGRKRKGDVGMIIIIISTVVVEKEDEAGAGNANAVMIIEIEEAGVTITARESSRSSLRVEAGRFQTLYVPERST